MNDIHINMFRRRKFCKRVVLLIVTLSLSFYVTILLFGDLRAPRILNLTNLHRCPACYGISVCPELYSGQISLDWDTWAGLFNAKNIFYGITKSNRRVVLKKLAHNWELKEFDSKICQTFNLTNNCKPKHLMNVTNIDELLLKMVQYNFTSLSTEPRKGLVICPYAFSLYDLIHPVLHSKDIQTDMINIWMMLSINPEPIILQVLKKSAGWPVPAYGGVCGRLEIVAHEGESLSTLTHIAWLKKLKYAKKILEAAMDFTFKHDRFRFYLMDWSLDNIVANEKDDITFVDLEDLVVLDKHVSPGKDLPDWYQRYGRDLIGSGFTFSIENMCKHHLSDHNLWAACYILAGDEDPFLYPIPSDINRSRPHFNELLKECLSGNDRFKTITKLQHVINDMLMNDKILNSVR